MPCGPNAPRTIAAFLKDAPDASRRICKALRTIIRRAAPELKEVMKWSRPCYEGKGLVCGFGAFKQHAALSFFRGKELADPDNLLQTGSGNAGMRSIRFDTVADIPKAKLTQLIKDAAKLDAESINQLMPKAKRAAIPTPAELKTALKNAPKAAKFYDSLPPSARREFNEWITEAKREETKQRRLKQSLEMLARGERRNESYR